MAQGSAAFIGLVLLLSSSSSYGDAEYHLVANIPERIVRIYLVPEGARVNDFNSPVYEFPIAVGTRTHRTPVIEEAELGRGRPRPAWYVPESSWAGDLAGERVSFYSRANPFRTRNENGEWEGYFIPVKDRSVGFHSTSSPRSVGRLASHGCMRMRLADVRRIYNEIPEGARVSIRYDLFRLSWSGKDLVIESFEDVYHRYSRSARGRRSALLEHLEGGGINPNLLTEDEIASATASVGRTVISGFGERTYLASGLPEDARRVEVAATVTASAVLGTMGGR